MQVTLEHLDSLLARPAFTRECKLTYTQLLEMKRRADWAADAAFEDGVYCETFRYTRIALRILQAMVNHQDKFANVEK